MCIRDRLKTAIAEVIVGQEYMIERLLVGLLANGHVLLEGAPGLAKTLAVTTLAQTLTAEFRRIQFTPDLLPADLVGTLIYEPKSGDFRVRKGPIFANLVLADENKSGTGEGAECIVRGDAGKPDDDRRGEFSITTALSGIGHTKPAGTGWHLSATRSPDGPFYAQAANYVSQQR